MIGSKHTSRQPPLDELGKLCYEGQQVAEYLFQVPDDESQWERLQRVVQQLTPLLKPTKHQEMARVVTGVQDVLAGPHTMQAADQLQADFDRLVKLWQLSKSGMV